MSTEDTIQEIIEGWMRLQRPAEHNARQILGLSHSQMGMLYMLFFHKNASVKQIAGNLDVSTSAVTQLVDPLLKKGLVSRQTDPKDRRVARLCLTAKGISSLKKFKKLKTAGLRAALNDLPAKDLENLAKLTQKMTVKGN